MRIQLSNASFVRKGCLIALLVAAAAPGSALAQQQFYAKPSVTGDVAVVDEAGEPVAIVTSEVGVRPAECPGNHFYVAQLPSDASQLVLTDCATDQGQYKVEMTGGPDADPN